MNLKDIPEFEASRVALKQFKRYAIIPKALYYDYILEGYTRILTEKSNYPEWEKEPYKNSNFFQMVNFAHYAIKNMYCKNTIRESKRQEIVDTKEEDLNAYFESLNMSTDCLNEEVDYRELKRILKEFFTSYKCKNKKVIYETLIQGLKPIEICKKLKIGYKTQNKIITNFRVDFFNYLIDIGYMESEKYFNQLTNKPKWQKLKLLRKEAKREGKSVNFDLFRNDMFIYKLIRDNEQNLNEYSKCLNIPKDKLQKIVSHNYSKARLFLYQINKLRRNYFNNYSLEELVFTREVVA